MHYRITVFAILSLLTIGALLIFAPGDQPRPTDDQMIESAVTYYIENIEDFTDQPRTGTRDLFRDPHEFMAAFPDCCHFQDGDTGSLLAHWRMIWTRFVGTVHIRGGQRILSGSDVTLVRSEESIAIPMSLSGQVIR